MKRKLLYILLVGIMLILTCFFFLYQASAYKELETNADNKDSISKTKEQTKDDIGWQEYTLVDEPADNNNTIIKSIENSVSILLLGVDSRKDDLVGRSDSIMLLTVNYETNTTNLVSIPRDSYVFIPGKGYDKLNHSYAYGQEDLTKATVEELLGIHIDYTATINFNSFVNVIDILGGINVDVPFNFTERDTRGNTLNFYEGTQLLDGDHALAYARMRKQDAEGDLGRGKRQQQVIESLINEVVSFDSIFKIKDLYSEVKSNIHTDLTISEILSIVNNNEALRNINKLQLQAVPISVDGISYMDIDSQSLTTIKQELQHHLSATSN